MAPEPGQEGVAGGSRSTPSTGSPSSCFERGGADTYKVRAAAFAGAAGRGGYMDADWRIAAASPRRAAAEHRRRREVDAHRSSKTRRARGKVLRPPDHSWRRFAPGDIELDALAQELLGFVARDCHSHSDWSDGGSPIREMAEAAKEIGHEYWALTDHSPRLTVAHGLDAERLRAFSSTCWPGPERGPGAHFRILTGIRGGHPRRRDGSLDQDLDLLAELDVVVKPACISKSCAWSRPP